MKITGTPFIAQPGQREYAPGHYIGRVQTEKPSNDICPYCFEPLLEATAFEWIARINYIEEQHPGGAASCIGDLLDTKSHRALRCVGCKMAFTRVR